MTTIRNFGPDDLDFALRQKVNEGWAASREQFEVYLEYQPDGCFIAEDRGEPVGMVTTTTFGASGWIANLIVEPDHRSRGIGRALMEHGLAHLRSRGAATVHLDGDPPGIPLYRRLGFVDEYESCRFVLPEPSEDSTSEDQDVEPMLPDDLDQVAALDASGVGEDRRRFLELKIHVAELTLVRRRNDRVVAWLLAAATDRGFRIGPCLADDPANAKRLLMAAVAAAAGRTVLIGVPAPNPAALAMLCDLGFEPRPSSLRMRLGPRLDGADPSRVFAIASGAVG
jgi:ribosomal protein S18 acetylase RimI-like enzyme